MTHGAHARGFFVDEERESQKQNGGRGAKWRARTAVK
jgi:hypothetical protein